MTATYVECPQCGKRALAVATRCPHCGFHFPPHPLNRPSDPPSLGPVRTALAVAGAVLAIVLVAVLMHRAPAPSGGAPAAAPQADSGRGAPVVTPVPAKASPPAAILDSAPSPTTGPAPAPEPAGTATRRYAQTWVNVRSDRARSSAAIAMLNPGDSIRVDSLVHGWYRVLVDGRTLGYAHRSTLGVTRPE